MANEKKYMDIAEFREKGFLQEANRCFFHPLGLALEVDQDAEGDWYISGVWDYREEPEGVLFAPTYLSENRQRFAAKRDFVQAELGAHADARTRLFGGSIIQPIPED